MEGYVMTDYQYQSILKSIKMILHGCSSIEEAEQRIDELLEREQPEKR